MLRTRVKRRGRWTEIPLGVRIAVSRNECQACGEKYGVVKMFYNKRLPVVGVEVQQLDHMIPRRWLVEQNIDPHQVGNLLSVCAHCHGKKKALEDRLWQGDVYSYLTGLKSINYPVHRVIGFALANGFPEFGGFTL